jgi:hypothetical protein
MVHPRLAGLLAPPSRPRLAAGVCRTLRVDVTSICESCSWRASQWRRRGRPGAVTSRRPRGRPVTHTSWTTRLPPVRLRAPGRRARFPSALLFCAESVCVLAFQLLDLMWRLEWVSLRRGDGGLPGSRCVTVNSVSSSSPLPPSPAPASIVTRRRRMPGRTNAAERCDGRVWGVCCPPFLVVRRTDAHRVA